MKRFSILQKLFLLFVFCAYVFEIVVTHETKYLALFNEVLLYFLFTVFFSFIFFFAFVMFDERNEEKKEEQKKTVKKVFAKNDNSKVIYKNSEVTLYCHESELNDMSKTIANYMQIANNLQAKMIHLKLLVSDYNKANFLHESFKQFNFTITKNFIVHNYKTLKNESYILSVLRK